MSDSFKAMVQTATFKLVEKNNFFVGQMICKIWTSGKICPDFHCPGRGVAETIQQQESIPVGCIPPTLDCMGGFPDRDHTLDRDHPLDKDHPWQRSP